VSDAPALVYLEADDEITTVARRVRAADAGRVVVVAPGRSRATSSAVALRLLARVGEEENRQVVVVGDALTRSLAAEAGLHAFASADEAQAASLETPVAAAPEGEPRHAAISVVRGAATDDTVAAPIATAASPDDAARDETLALTVPRTEGPAVKEAPRPVRRRNRSLGLAAVLGVAGALLVAGIVAGAALLPAATIVVVPRSVPVVETYEIVVTDPVRHDGTVEATVSVTATGSYETLEPAVGAVVLFNWTFFPVEVPAGTFVAAGEQAFATQEDITVPRGRLTSEGTIAAGEQSVAVVAAAPGPAANVGATAIDTVVNEQVDARLRGFPENPQRRVTNPEPTTGGLEATGPEITESDVDAAVNELRAELRRLADEARPDADELALLDTSPSDPRIEVPDDLVGTRDVPSAEISGSLDWEVVGVDLDELEAEAEGRLASDPALPEGHDLVSESVTVELAAPMRQNGEIVVSAIVEAVTLPRIDRDEVMARASGRSAEEARLALADIGDATVTLWPGWVETVPDLQWRVDVRIEDASP
jgi:hypothetical protein